MTSKRLKVRMGVERVRKPAFASEPFFMADVKKQMKAITDDLEYVMDQFADVTPEIAKDALQPTFDKSQVYCPYRTGDLRNSGYLEIVSTGDRPYVEIGYGKNGRPRYAQVVHEMPGYHPPPTRSKWLQAAVDEDMFQIIDRVSEGYRRFMGE